jgi:dihydrofolate reductase
MRRLILKMSISVDGFVAGPNGEIDWMLRSRDEGGKRWVEDTLWQAGLHAMGRKTYFGWAGYWPASTDPLAAPMNAIPKVVFTRQKSLTLAAENGTTPGDASQTPGPGAVDPASWAAAEVMSGDLATGITRLKQQPGKDILAQGGAGFAQSLVASGLIDEYRLVVHPVALGNGRSLFAQLPKPLDLQLRATTLFRSGTAAQVYWPA